MIQLTERERILRTYRRQEIDRIPMICDAVADVPPLTGVSVRGEPISSV